MQDIEAAVRLENVVQRRMNFELGPLDLVIPKGFITAIVGPNGCGKSSTFRLLLDLEKPDAGRLTMLEHTIGSGPDTALKQRIGYLPEAPYTGDDRMIASEKAAFNKFWYDNWDSNRYRELLRLLEVDDSWRLSKMSKGMRRKFDIALALAHAPELLLLDEPSSGLDPLAWKKMIELLHHYMDSGDRTIIMTSHIVEEVKRLADYIVFMANGRILGMYEKDELFSSWQTQFISGEGLTAELAAMMPGQCGIEYAGGTTYRITTNNAAAAEVWRDQQGLQLISRQSLTLDEILETLVLNERKSIRFDKVKGVGL